jgi:hypothetical protein
VDESIESDASEVWDDRDSYSSCGFSSLLHSDDHEGRFPPFQLPASPQTGLSPPNPRIVHLHFTAQRFAFKVHHRSAELVEHHPCCLVTSQTELTLQHKR